MRLSEFIAGLQDELASSGDGEVFYTWEGVTRTPYFGPRPSTGVFDDGDRGEPEGVNRAEGQIYLDCNWRP